MVTLLGYLAGSGSVIVVLVSVVWIGAAGRRLLVPHWTGAMGVLGAWVVANTFLVALGELLGSIGLFSRVPIVLGSVATAGALLAVRGARSRQQSERAERTRGRPSCVVVLAALSAGLVIAQGGVAVYGAMHSGVTFIDAIEYHLTTAAQFATTHHTTAIVQLSPGSPVPYYPFNDELLHGMTIALFGRDSLTLLLGVVDTVAMLLAAWCVGSADGRGPLALIAVCPIVAVLGPVEASTMNDWAATWPLIAAVAVAIRLRTDGEVSQRGAFVVAGAAVGLAAGAKLSSLAPALLLLAALPLCAQQGTRRAALLFGSAGALIAGGYWYVRDFVLIGSPLPSQHVPGLPQVPIAGVQEYGYTVAHYLTNGSVIRHFYIPGLRVGLNRAWPLLLAVMVVGVVAAVARPTRKAERVIAAATVIAAAAYLVTPTGAFGPRDQPYLFTANLRYAMPAMALALMLAAISSVSRRWPTCFATVAFALYVVRLAGYQTWLEPTRYVVTAVLLACLAVLVVLLAPRALRGREPTLRHAGVVVAACVVLGVVVGYPLNRFYLHHRYAPGIGDKRELYASLNGQTGKKIGVVGLPGIYPFQGPTYANRVSYVGRERSDHAFLEYATCTAWRRAVAAGRYDFIVAETSPGEVVPPARGWTASDPAARTVLANPEGAVFAIDSGFGDAPCPASVGKITRSP
ncbi:MAG TPA: hypothetical protein VHB18_03235 [Mycobacteriales bacterium]|nr:hypothetical protein [Mycobacteriales bacterium]